MPYRTKFRVSPAGVFSMLDEASGPGGRIELSSVIFAGEEEWFEFLTVVDNPALEPASLKNSDRISRVQHCVTDAPQRTQYFLLRAEEPAEFIVTTLTQNGAVPYRIFLRDGQVTVVTSVQDWGHVRDLADAIEDVYATFELLGTTQVEGVGHPLGSERLPYDVHTMLSEEQLRVLDTAHEMGLFEIPQEATGKDVAERLGISQSTVSEKLRRAQQSLCERFFGQRQLETPSHEVE